MNESSTEWGRLLLLANVAATLYLVGLIWQVQIVHYPLFAQVGDAGFATYARLHSNLITLVVGPPMLLEAATTALLLAHRPANIPFSAALLGAVLLAAIWLSTMFLQAPQHNRLAAGFDVEAHRFLVFSNWIRTLAWSARGALALWMTAKAMR
ncbi:MAG: hypothetical protein SF339_00975 [Blastocatellia bacterium]|nr:hypothetical protein [Blastocatellia bacterium]